jgi:subtilase family serine protease
VVFVGGPTLNFNSNGTLSSKTSGGGGGCSAYETATAAQSGFSGYTQAHCAPHRATPDVSLDANPASGKCRCMTPPPTRAQSGWFTVGGTSASSPMWAARSAAAAVVNSRLGLRAQHHLTRHHLQQQRSPMLVGYDLCTGRGSRKG